MRILLLNQAFYPDPVASAQHAADLALELVGQGHQVSVICSGQGYDDPDLKFPDQEVWRGISIHRFTATRLGKSQRWRRAIDFGTAMLRYVTKLATFPHQNIVIAMSSPPLIAFIGALFTRLRGGQLVCWTLDLNPAEAIAAGWLTEGSPITRILKAQARFAYATADRIVALDSYMADQIRALGVRGDRITVIAPWAHDRSVQFDRRRRDEFRKEHGLLDKFVVMHSGNHSPCHPLDTLLEAAIQLRDEQQIVFCFVGGGSKFRSVQDFAARHLLTNVLCLPYQRFEDLSASLSAADLHIVVMGDRYVGAVHPCKVYNILALGIPFLYIGPSPSHVTDLLPLGDTEWAQIARHGDVSAVVNAILSARNMSGVPFAQERETGARFSQRALTPLMANLVLSVTAELSVERVARTAPPDTRHQARNH